MQLIAIEEIHYAGSQRHPGDEFEAPDIHAKLLIMRNVARPASPAVLQNTAVKSEDQPSFLAANPSKPRRYKRRDMRADE